MPKHSKLACVVLSCLAVITACDGGEETDAGADAAVSDAGSDAGGSDDDAGSMDGGTDSGMSDGGSDAGPELLPPIIIATTAEVTIDPYTCGATPPAAVTATIQNMGGRPGTIVFEEALTGGALADIPWFSVSVVDRILDPGESTHLVITPTPSAPIQPGTLQGSVRVGAAEAPGISTVSVSMNVTGPFLVVSRSAQDFGAIPVGRSADVFGNITLYNQGNAPATIDVTRDFDPGFEVSWTGMPSAIELAGGASTLVNVAFRPTAEGPARGTLAVSTETSLCGVDADFLSAGFSGTGITGSLGLSALELDFGTDPCGDAGEARSVTLSNNGAAALDWSASLAGTGRFTLSGVGGTIAAGGSATLTVTSTAAPASASTVPVDLSDTVTVTSSVGGDVPRVIPLRRTLGGARLRWLQTSTEELVAPLGESASTIIHLVNEGTMAATVSSLVHPSTITTTPSTDIEVPAGRRVPITVTYTPTTSARAVLSVSTSTITGPVCGLPASGVSVPVRTAGVLEFSPSILTLGASCGSRPTGLVLVSNRGTAAENATLTLEPPGAFEARVGGAIITSELTIPAGATTAIEITTSAPFPSDGAPATTMSGSATIRTASGRSHEVLLYPHVQGAYVQAQLVDPGAWQVPIQHWTNYEVLVTNSGDRPFMFQAFFPNGTDQVFTVPIATDAGPGTVRLRSDVFVPNEGPLTPAAAVRFALLAGQSSEGLCSGLPHPISLRPTGIVGALAIDTAPISFGDNPCGGPAPPARIVTLRNDGPAPLGYSANVVFGTRFQVLAGHSGVIPAGGTSLVTVGARVAGSGSVPGASWDTLVIQSDVPGDVPRAIHLEQTVRGAVLDPPSSVALRTIDVGGELLHHFRRIIRGNVNAELTFDEQGSDPLDELGVGRLMEAGDWEHVILFRPRAAGTKSFSLQPRLPADVPICSGSLDPIEVTSFVGPAPVRSLAPSRSMVVQCGESPSNYQVRFENVTSSPVEFTLVNDQGSSARLYASPVSGTIPAGGTVTIDVLVNGAWPAAPTLDFGSRAESIERWRERIALVIGPARVEHQLSALTYGHGYILEPWAYPSGTGYVFGRRFLSARVGSGPSLFSVVDSSTGGCLITENGAGTCTSEGGTVTHTTSTTLTSGICVPPGSRTSAIP